MENTTTLSLKPLGDTSLPSHNAAVSSGFHAVFVWEVLHVAVILPRLSLELKAERPDPFAVKPPGC